MRFLTVSLLHLRHGFGAVGLILIVGDEMVVGQIGV